LSKAVERYWRTELWLRVLVPWLRSPFDVTTLLDPDPLYVVMSHSELDFGGAQKIEDLTDSKNFCTEILQKIRLFCLAKKKLGG